MVLSGSMAELKIWMVNLIVFHPPGISDDFSDPQLPGMEFLVGRNQFLLTVWRNSNFQSTPNRLNLIKHHLRLVCFNYFFEQISLAAFRKKHMDPPQGPGWLCYQVGHSLRRVWIRRVWINFLDTYPFRPWKLKQFSFLCRGGTHP